MDSVDYPLGDLPPDATLLISGPPMTGKYELLLSVLDRNADAAIVISTKYRASKVRSDFEATTDPDATDVGVVDCVSHYQPGETVEETPTTKFAKSPENLARLGVRFMELFEHFDDDPDREPAGVGIHSLSQLLMHAEVQSVYQFIEVLSGQIRSAGRFGAAVVDGAVVDEQQIQMIQQQFDGMIKTRENEDGGREFRLRGFGSSTAAWTRF